MFLFGGGLIIYKNFDAILAAYHDLGTYTF